MLKKVVGNISVSILKINKWNGKVEIISLWKNSLLNLCKEDLVF